MTIYVALKELKRFFAGTLRFNWVDAEISGDAITVHGLVLTREDRDHVYEHSEGVWRPIKHLVRVALHLLFLFHIVVDSIIVYIAYLCLEFFPKKPIALIWLHDAGTYIIVTAMLIHLCWVLYENSGR